MFGIIKKWRSTGQKENEAFAPLFEGDHKLRPSGLARRFQDRFTRTMAPLLRDIRNEGAKDSEIYPLVIFLASNVLIVEITALTAKPEALLPDGARRPKAVRDITPLDKALRILLRPMVRLGHPYPDLMALVVLSTANAVEASLAPLGKIPA